MENTVPQMRDEAVHAAGVAMIVSTFFLEGWFAIFVGCFGLYVGVIRPVVSRPEDTASD